MSGSPFRKAQHYIAQRIWRKLTEAKITITKNFYWKPQIWGERPKMTVSCRNVGYSPSHSHTISFTKDKKKSLRMPSEKWLQLEFQSSIKVALWKWVGNRRKWYTKSSHWDRSIKNRCVSVGWRKLGIKTDESKYKQTKETLLLKQTIRLKKH